MTFKPKSVRPSSQELLATVGRVAAESGQLPTAPEPVVTKARTGEVASPDSGPNGPREFQGHAPVCEADFRGVGEGRRCAAHDREDAEGGRLRRSRARP